MITTLIIIAYALIGLGVGWCMGQHVYRYGTNDGVRPGNAGWSIATMLIHGATWPILAGGLVISLLCGITPWDTIARKIFRGS